MSSPARERRGMLRRFFRECVRPYAALQVQIGLCLLIGVALQLLDPLLFRALIDRALGDGNPGLLLLLSVALVVALLFRTAFRLVSVWLYSYSGLRILFDFRQRVFEHVERLSIAFYRGQRRGDVLARITSDVDILQRAAAQTLVNAVQDLLTIAAIVGLLIWLDPVLTLWLAVAYPPLAVALMGINRRLRRESERARTAVGDLYVFLEERLQGMRLVQEYLQEKAQARRHVQVSRPWVRANLRLSLLGALQVSLTDVMATVALIAVFFQGGRSVLAGELSLGSLIAFYTLAARLYRPVAGLIDINIDLQMARASLQRIFELLDTPPEVTEAEDAEVPPAFAAAIHLRDVALRFEDHSFALQDVNLEVLPGQCVALVGPSGSGKSTLVHLLARHLDATRGAVLVGGLDVRRWKLPALRREVAIVSQETLLFHDTLENNLRLARRHATRDEVHEALRVAGLEGLVSRLPEGLETVVGQEGMRFSGGERQRLALARALLKQASIYILDETTSALDPGTEREVMESFTAFTRGKTLIWIAHRLTSVTAMDRIFVLQHGRIVEAGTHPELIRRRGLYRSLWDDQAREDEPRQKAARGGA